MKYRPSRDGSTMVAKSFHYDEIDSRTPRGVKLILISEKAGVAVLGTLGSNIEHWTHWAPLPTFKHDKRNARSNSRSGPGVLGRPVDV